MRIKYTLFLGFACLAIAQTPALLAEEQKAGPSWVVQPVAAAELADFKEKRQEQTRIELENALNRARLEKELAPLQAEVQRLLLEKEAVKLRWEAEQEKKLESHAKEMIQLKQQEEKLRAEVALSQAQVAKVLEKFNAASAELQNQAKLLKIEAEQLQAEVERHNAKQQRAAYVGGEALYLKEPLQKDGSLVISDRRVDLNGIITDWKANYVTDRIQYFNNKDVHYPIFLVIENSPGGSAMAGWRILKAMHNSKAPVYVVVKSFAASLAAHITTLAERSYAYPNATILHHQLRVFKAGGHLREQKETYEEMQKAWKRLGGPLAKKMGISLQALDQKFYEKSAHGDWAEFADDAQKLKWVDHIISGVTDTGTREMPNPTNYTWEKYGAEYLGSITHTDLSTDASRPLPLLGPKDFYYLYNPDNQFQLRSGK